MTKFFYKCDVTCSCPPPPPVTPSRPPPPSGVTYFMDGPLVPRSRTPLAQSRSFASIGSTLWNTLSPSVRHTLYFSFRQSFVFLCLSLNLFFLMRLAHWQRF